MKKILIIISMLVIFAGCSFVEETKEKTMNEINNWCNEFIDKDLTKMKDYLTSQVSSIDVNETLDDIENSITKLKEYNEEIQLIDDQEIKDAWDKLYNEMIKNYDAIKNNESFDTTKLEQYQKEFEKMINKNK
ncbi:MAG: hypothetical protein U0L85_05180 [Bacilli bacterium]|nr:hypothetical protein [Bacilli bacterium]